MAMIRKGLMISPELCLGCKSCQVACKQWNQLDGIKTINTGTYENPSDLSSTLYNRIKFVEVPSPEGDPRWLFVTQRCCHCHDAGCMKICPVPGALFRTKDDAVAFDKEKCNGCKLCFLGCPFSMPRFDEKGKISKCHLCHDRLNEGLTTACAKTCPSGAIKYGEREALIAEAKKAGYTTFFGLKDFGGLGDIYAFKDPWVVSFCFFPSPMNWGAICY